MDSTLNSQSQDFSPEVIKVPEEKTVSVERVGILEDKTSRYTLEEEVSLAIAKAIDSMPRVPDDLVLSSKHALESAENISSVEFENRTKNLEEIFGTLKRGLNEAPNDMQSFANIVYRAAQKLMQNGDYRSLDDLHDGAIEIARGQEPMLN